MEEIPFDISGLETQVRRCPRTSRVSGKVREIDQCTYFVGGIAQRVFSCERY